MNLEDFNKLYQLFRQKLNNRNELEIWLREIKNNQTNIFSNFFEQFANDYYTALATTGKLNIDDIVIENYKSITLLAAGVAHEFNNLIAGISGYLEALESTANSEQLQMLNKINLLIQRAENLAQKLFDLARNTEQEKIELAVESEIQNIIDLYKFALKEFTVKIETEFNHTAKLIFNRADFNSIIANLLLNSYEALKKKYYAKNLEINQAIQNKITNEERPKIIIKTYNDANFFYINFWDSGCGIDDKMLHLVFNPLFSTKENNDRILVNNNFNQQHNTGIGLGLTIVKKIILENYGDISVSSKLNQYTEFKISLPLNLQQINKPLLKIQPVAPKIKNAVIFIHDNQHENFLVKEYLINNGISIFDNLNNINAIDIIIFDSADIEKLNITIKLAKNQKLKLIFFVEPAMVNYFANIRLILENEHIDSIYFLIKPLNFLELNRLLDFCNNQSENLPFIRLK